MNGTTVCPDFAIEINWERLDRGPAEERATFGAIGIRVDGAWLTEAHDAFARRVRQKVHLSGYSLAQWLAWNWWRLRWEPRRRSLGWAMAHRFTSIGGGYIWPNVDCDTDGERVLLHASPARPRASEPLRYVADQSSVLSVAQLETGVEAFVALVVDKLRDEGIGGSNLEGIWNAVCEEREDSEAVWYRRIEASMGFDPDEADERLVSALNDEVGVLGKSAIAELAADAPREVTRLNAKELRKLATSTGHEADLTSIPRLPVDALEMEVGVDQAWEVGEEAARLLRKSEGLGDGPVSNQRLAELAGTSPDVLQADGSMAPFSFQLAGDGPSVRVVLQSPIETSRRFALARLVGDRLLETAGEPLVPIMRSYTYRQKVQRAFGAELLLPLDTLVREFDDDLSDENQERIAAQHIVSPMLVATKLANSGLVDRQTLERF